ncbi:MAG: efflux RND transporter periplasmic adaptor subunit [Thermoanaerobaculales bacterium]
MLEVVRPEAVKKIRWAHVVPLLIIVMVSIPLLFGCGKQVEKGEEETSGHVAAGRESGAGEGAMVPGEVMIDARKQQLMGVTYGVVERRDVEQTIRTVGSVAYDEKRLTDISLKFGGWIEELFVDETGMLVEKGQRLFTLFSPELISTQEDYLTAYDLYNRIQGSERGEAIEAAGRLLASSRQRLQYWDIKEVHWKDLERDRKILRALPIHSPASGYVIEKDVVEGSHVLSGKLLYRLADLDRVWVLADIYESELPQVEIGQKATVSLSYLPGVVFRGRVTYVYPYLDTSERTVKIRVELANPGHRLKAGMYTNVELASHRAAVLVVPQTAVIDSGKRQIVFLDSGEGRFEPREVRLGTLFDEGYEVLDGLEAGDRVVTSANFLLDSESQLAAGMGQMQH